MFIKIKLLISHDIQCICINNNNYMYTVRLAKLYFTIFKLIIKTNTQYYKMYKCFKNWNQYLPSNLKVHLRPWDLRALLKICNLSDVFSQSKMVQLPRWNCKSRTVFGPVTRVRDGVSKQGYGFIFAKKYSYAK